MTIVSDNGPQFSSNEFTTFCQQNGIEHTTTSQYNPESNGKAERFVRTLKTGITKNISSGKDLYAAIRLFLTTYCTLPHPGLNYKSPASVLHGRQPRGLLELLLPNPKVTTNS